jgi:hypothetical protein
MLQPCTSQLLLQLLEMCGTRWKFERNRKNQTLKMALLLCVNQIGIGPGVSLGATVVIGSETLNNPATYSGASSASGSTSSSATSSAGTAAASIRSSILASLSSHTMSNSANAASIRSGIESSLSAATASPSVSSISDGADPAPASLTTTKYALIASLGAALAGAFLL